MSIPKQEEPTLCPSSEVTSHCCAVSPFPVLPTLLDHLEPCLLHVGCCYISLAQLPAQTLLAFEREHLYLLGAALYLFIHMPVFSEVVCPKATHLPDVRHYQQYSIYLRSHHGSNRFCYINNYPKSYWLKTATINHYV